MVVCPFVLFLSAILLSVIHPYTDSDYPFGICKLFLRLANTQGRIKCFRENTRLVIIYRNCQTFPGVYMNQFWGDNYNLIHLQHVWMYVRQLNHVIVEQVMMTTIKHCKIWLDEIGTSCIANATVFSFKENKGIKKIKFVVACH
jgi:hypothetical protein